MNATTMDGKGPRREINQPPLPQSGKPALRRRHAEGWLGKVGWGQGVCAGDYDNDGFAICLSPTTATACCTTTRATARFKDVTEAAGLRSDAIRWDSGCSFFDYDLDGKLDLAVTSYVDFDPSKVPEPGAGSYCQWKGMPVMCGPRGLPTGRTMLFHNDGKGKFTDVSAASGIEQTRRLLRFHRARIRFRQRWLSRLVRSLRLQAQPALSQPEERHLRRSRRCFRRGAE